MGDYLRNLTARANGAPAAVRPRLPSLFEPAPVAASMRVSSLAGLRRPREAQMEVTDEMEIAQPATSAPLSPRRHDVSRAIRQPEAHDDPPPSPQLPQERLPRHVAQQGPEPLPPKLPSEVAEPGHAISAAPSAALELKRADAPTPLPLPAEREKQKAQPPASSPHQVVETTLVREVRTIERDAPPAAIRRLDSAAPTTDQPTPARPPVASTSVRPVPVSRPANPVPPVFTEPLEPAAPTVQVIIGRVTVNAVAPQPAAPAPPPRPQSPRLSLDDYLKQREVRT